MKAQSLTYIDGHSIKVWEQFIRLTDIDTREVEDANKASAYRKVERHNGLEAWRIMAEPISEDKSLARTD